MKTTLAKTLGILSVMLAWPCFNQPWCLAATAPAATSASPTEPVAPPKPPKPPEPPPSVPDNVNPFADEKTLPTPLKFPGALRPRIDVDVHPEDFDGMRIMFMDFKGPDFDWQFQPLADFTPAPASVAESAAFIYQPKPTVRLSWSLYAPKELLPDFTPAAMVQYLAALRAPAPKDFVLLTPFPKDAIYINPDNIRGFPAQSVKYAIVGLKDVIVFHDWFLDLNHEYLLVVSLSAPQEMMDKMEAELYRFFVRSRVIKGLGVKEEKPAPAQPAGTNTAGG